MKHLILPNKEIGKILVKLLQTFCNNFEIHEDGKIIRVPYTISKKKLQKLISTALK